MLPTTKEPISKVKRQTHFRARNTYRLKAKEWRNIFHVNENQKKTRVAILISDKVDFKEYFKRQRKTLHND